jgi:hypothetical protein
MKNVISMQEYIHNRDHAGMGCGPMQDCSVCKNAMGEDVSDATDAVGSSFVSMSEIAKYLVLATIGTVFLELVVKPAINKRKKK